ncbi:MAG: hypothetical protein ACREPM_24875 [Gemmatimonadaceae bacterium]
MFRAHVARANPRNDSSLQNRILRTQPCVLRPVLSTLALLLVGACADSLRAFGPNPATAEAHADQLFEAFATRFSPSELTPKYAAARVRLAQTALTPSRIFNDTLVWESRPSPSERVLFVSGEAEGGGKYRLESRPALTPPVRPGDTRHVITLEQLDPNVYRWDTRVDLAIGGVTAEEMSELFTTLFVAADGRTDAELRGDYRAAFPRAAAAFGHGFSIDSLTVSPGAQGTTSVSLVGVFRPELMRGTYPALAQYVDKYLGPAKYHFLLTDRTGAALFDVAGANRSIAVKWRVHQGKLTSLFGPPRPWPDTLVLTSDVTLKVKVFTVGFQGLVSDFIVSNAGHDRGWIVVSQREPKWVLPFITERLIRSPLRRPFEGAGTTLRFEVHDSAGTQTVLSRRARLDVQESSIMRFIGSLAGHALGDLDVRVEGEEDRFLRDGFAALQGDLGVLAGRWREKGPESESATKP